MALVAGGGVDSQRCQPLPATLLSQLLPPVRGLRVAAPYYSDDDEVATLIPTVTPASSTSASSNPAPSTSFPAATAAKRWRPFGRVGDVFGTWTKQGHDEPYADMDIEMASHERAPLVPTGTPASSTSASSDPAPTTSFPASTAAKRWRPFGRVGDVFDTWTKQGHNEPYAGIDDMDSGAGYRQSAASSSVASASGSVVGAGAASGQRGTADWMKRFKGLLLAYVFFVLPIILFFFPRYDKSQNHPVLQNLMDSSKINSEKVAVLVFFVILLTAGVLGVLLAHIAQGPKVTTAVGAFTLWIIISILGFMDYVLVKTMPDNLTNKLMFLSHFIITTTIICLLWFKYVWPSSCCQRGTRQD